MTRSARPALFTGSDGPTTIHPRYDCPRTKGDDIDTITSFGSVAITIVFGLAIWIEARSFPREVWVAANYRRTFWLIYLFIPVMSVVYLLVVRPKLHKTRRRMEAQDPPRGVTVTWADPYGSETRT